MFLTRELVLQEFLQVVAVELLALVVEDPLLAQEVQEALVVEEMVVVFHSQVVVVYQEQLILEEVEELDQLMRVHQQVEQAALV